MKKSICEAKRTGQVKRRGKVSIEWYDADGKPQSYCLGYFDRMTDELIPACKRCPDHVEHAQEDLERALFQKKGGEK